MPMETKGDQRRPKETKGDQMAPNGTKGHQRGPNFLCNFDFFFDDGLCRCRMAMSTVGHTTHATGHEAEHEILRLESAQMSEGPQPMPRSEHMRKGASTGGSKQN